MADLVLYDAVDVLGVQLRVTGEDVHRPLGVLLDALAVLGGRSVGRESGLHISHLCLQAAGQDGETHDLDEADVFFFDMVELCVGVIDAQRMLRRGDVVAQHQIELEPAIPHPGDRGDGVELLAALTGFELTRGVLCAFRRPAPRPVEELCRDARRVAVLEGIVDSTNVGAIFRSAAALNMDAVLINPSCCDPLCRRAVRVSMGTVFQVPWAQIGQTPADWPEKGMEQLHALGFKTAAMALSDRSVSIDDEQLAKEPKLAIVLGTEGDGLARSTIAACDYTVKIPMSHGGDSLNVAAASAVAFWQLGNQ